MRLSDERLMAGFVHPSRVVRGAVADFFADRFTRDPEVTRWAIRGAEQFGWQDFLAWPHKFGKLPLLDDDSFEWVCQQVERQEPATRRLSIRWHLTRMLAAADATILARHQSRLLAMDVFDADVREAIVRRIELSQADPEVCWQASESHCIRAAQTESFAAANIPEAKRLLEPLARAGESFVPRILEVLQRPLPEPDSKHPDQWLIGLMISLAGQLRLEQAVPLLWNCWAANWDWYNEEVMFALTRIGTPSVLQMIRERYSKSEWYVRNFSHNVFENTRGDETIAALEEAIAMEEDDFLRGQLGVAAGAQYDDRAARLALQIWNENPQDGERDVIREFLVAFSHLSGWELAERDQWEADINAEVNRIHNEAPSISGLWQKIAKLAGLEASPTPLPPTHSLRGTNRLDETKIRIIPPLIDARPIAPHRIVLVKPQVGRNDPCLCGSGKKYKKCCLKETARAT